MNFKKTIFLSLIILSCLELHGQYVKFSKFALQNGTDTTSIFSGKYSWNLNRLMNLSLWIENNRSGCPDVVFVRKLDSIQSILKSYNAKRVNYALLSPQIDNLIKATDLAYKDFYERVSPYGKMKQELFQKKQDGIDSLILEAIRLREDNKYELALQYFRKAIDIDSTRLNNYFFAIDNELFVNGDTTKALSYLDKLARLNNKNKTLNFCPENAYVYLLLQKQQYDKALYYANKILEKDSTDYQAAFNSAKIQYKLKNYAISNTWYHKLLKNINNQPFASSSDSAFVYNNIAWNYYLMKEYKLCVEYADLALLITPNNSDAIDTRASGYYGLGEYEKCIDEMTKALRLNPELDNSWYLRGLSYKKLNELDKACSDLSTALSMGTTEALEDMTNYCKEETVAKIIHQYKFQDSKKTKVKLRFGINDFGSLYFLLN